VDGEDSFATLAKRYGTGADLVSSANHDVLPEAGSLVVIPAAYPGDRIPMRSTPKVAARYRPPAKKAVASAPHSKPKTRAALPAAKIPTKASAAKRSTVRG
jgi:hypothetical protein